MSRRMAWIGLWACVGLGCDSQAGRDLEISEQGDSAKTELAARPHFVDITAEAGIDFEQVSGGSEQRFILESMSGGAAWLDSDGDGYLDLFLVNGSRAGVVLAEETNRLYRNRGGRDSGTRFVDVTREAGLEQSGWGMGSAVGDYDNDGDVDLYVTYWGENLLYQNDGQGHFSAVEAGVGDQRWSVSAAFGDVDADGWLDLYVTNYLEFDLEEPPGGGEPCTAWKGLAVFCGPQGMLAQADGIYRNKDGKFEDMSAATGVDKHRFPGLGVVFSDCDGDGDQDLYVANDSQPNLLFRNDGDWQLSEVGALAGVAYSEEGRAQAGMGLAAGDFDNDGDEDLYATNFSDDVNTLYANRGGGLFVDATAAAGLAGVVRPYLGWSTGFVDFDNDGWLDLFVANGHLYPQLAQLPAGLGYAQRNLLYWNEAGRFELAVPVAGLAAVQVSRGAAFGDMDNDGDTDVLVVNLNDKAQLLENVGGNRNQWVGLDLEGLEGNNEGIGAVVEVQSGGASQRRQIRRGYGYGASHDGRAVFGLGAAAQVERVLVRWPGGAQASGRGGGFGAV